MPSRATVSDSTESQVIAVNVRDHLVDDVGSTRSLITDVLRILARCVTEVVDCERLIAIIDEFDNFTYILEWEYGHHGSKYFLFHQLRVQVRLQYNCRLDVASFSVSFSATNECATGSIDQVLDSVAMEVIDHLALILTAIGLLTVHLFKLDLNLLNEFFDL